ncbi:MAG TPA: PQQ-binding-like beta-propeller repeat protein [Bryobacteraceae bacterium]|nr:PQQ-binding-like beta-propeller repeat protein [Bryobacteraceae bacterium]
MQSYKTRDREAVLKRFFLLAIATAAFVGYPFARLVPAAAQPAPGNVTEARVIAEASTGDDWPVGGRTFDEQHFSPLKQITDRNIGKLGLAWSTDIESAMGLATEPIVVDGVIYVSAPQSRVYAVDASTGKVLWKFDPKVRIDRMRNSWAAHSNRGLAVWQGKVYVGTGDCRLVAIDAASGREAWESPVCDGAITGITGAPHVGGGKVFIGYNGSDTGVRGSLVAFDAATGKQAWRFWTVPGDPAKGFESKALEVAAKTWSGDQWWKVGGGDVWDPITYDPAAGLVIFGTAGATPEELFGDKADMQVGGDRLYSGCIIAVNAETGKYVWHFQTSGRNYHTENMHILLADLTLNGEKRRVAITAPKNGFIYVLDEKTGALLEAKPIAQVGWASSIDIKTGRPVELPAPAHGRRPMTGGHNWWPMSYSPITGLVYLPLHDPKKTPLKPGEFPEEGKLLAWDPVSQSARWSVDEPIATNSAVLSTAGNLVFQGQGTGEFAAYTADTGRRVWSVMTGSAIHSVPVSFAIHGAQYILVPVGWGSGSRLFSKGSSMATPEAKRGPARLLAFKLGGTTPFPEATVRVPPVPKPPVQTFSKEMIQLGATLYTKDICFDCHGPEADGSGAYTEDGAIPDLRYLPAESHKLWYATVLGGSHRKEGMPGFGNPPGYPFVVGKLTKRDADAIHAYIIDQSWKAYNAEHANPQRSKPN